MDVYVTLQKQKLIEYDTFTHWFLYKVKSQKVCTLINDFWLGFDTT